MRVCIYYIHVRCTLYMCVVCTCTSNSWKSNHWDDPYNYSLHIMSFIKRTENVLEIENGNQFRNQT